MKIQIKLTRAYLRNLREEDLEDLHALYHAQGVREWLPLSFTQDNKFQTLQILRHFIQSSNKPEGLALAITNMQDQLIGCCALEAYVPDHRRYEVAFELHPNYQKRGIMHEAMKNLLRIAFENYQAHRLDAYTLTHNLPSQKTLEKLGFQKEGVLKDFRKFRESYHDIVIFGLTHPQWQQPHAS